MILQKSDMLWTPLSIDIVVPLSLRDVVRARVFNADSHGCGRHSRHHIFNARAGNAGDQPGATLGYWDSYDPLDTNGRSDYENIDWLSSR